jgi:hypothetical protein
MFEILNISLVCSVIQVLQYTADEFIFTDLKRALSKSRRIGIRTELDHESRGLEVSKI